MANADGGTIVVGLSDGRVTGTDGDPRWRNAIMQAAVDFAEPPVRTRHRLLGCFPRFAIRVGVSRLGAPTGR